jgi:hypothetical protein
MGMRTKRLDGWMTAAVVVHLVISVLHGRAHDGGHVALTEGQSLFVYVIILAAPLAGLAISVVRRRLGGAIVAAAMAASLLFGLVNHFLVISPDHVSQVTAAWRWSFTATAVLLVISEAAGVAAGLRSAVGQEVVS